MTEPTLASQVPVNFVVYELATGRVMRAGTCAQSVLEMQHCGESGVAVLKTDKLYADPGAVVVFNGVVVPAPQSE